MAPAPDPINLDAALARFDQVWRPRIVTQVNDYDVRIAHAQGDHVWHVHDDTDEFFLVLTGQFNIALRSPDGTESTVTLHPGDVYVVPRGTEHKPSSPAPPSSCSSPPAPPPPAPATPPSPPPSTAPPATPSSRNRSPGSTPTAGAICTHFVSLARTAARKPSPRIGMTVACRGWIIAR